MDQIKHGMYIIGRMAEIMYCVENGKTRGDYDALLGRIAPILRSTSFPWNHPEYDWDSYFINQKYKIKAAMREYSVIDAETLAELRTSTIASWLMSKHMLVHATKVFLIDDNVITSFVTEMGFSQNSIAWVNANMIMIVNRITAMMSLC